MEEWKNGILEVRAEINHFNCKKLLQTHYSITPSFLPRETFFYFTGAVIPIGAKSLSSGLCKNNKLSTFRAKTLSFLK